MKIKYMSQDRAEKLKAKPNAAMISITSSGDGAMLDINWEYLLRLEFDDVEEAGETGSFKRSDALKIRDFLSALPDSVSELYIHCMAGQSRSGAVARALNEYYGNKIHEDDYNMMNIRVYEVLTEVLG